MQVQRNCCINTGVGSIATLNAKIRCVRAQAAASSLFKVLCEKSERGKSQRR
jgi:hypothetical protein